METVDAVVTDPGIDAMPQAAFGRQPLFCDYFRLPRHSWATMLLRVCQLAGDSLVVRVPWGWHQPTEEWVDLQGATHPRRDLLGFVRMCDRLHLPLVMQPELLPDAGLIAQGLPCWLVQRHPEARAAYEVPPGAAPLLSVEHPLYLEHLQRWLGTLSKVLLPFQSPAGPIVAFQFPAPPSGDRNAHVARVLWPIWLRQRYDGIAALNATWGANFESFNAVDSCAGAGIPGQDEAAFAAWFEARRIGRRTEYMGRLAWNTPVIGDHGPVAGAIRQAEDVARVEEDAPALALSLSWAHQAPATSFGEPTPRFWSAKAERWARVHTDSSIEAAVVSADAGKVRLPASAGKDVWRLFLDGRLIPDKTHGTRNRPTMDYRLYDADGATDMYLALSAEEPLPAPLGEYLQRLLSARATALDYAQHISANLAAALRCETVDTTSNEGYAALPDAMRAELEAAQQALLRARLAAIRTAISLGELEHFLGPVAGREMRSPGAWLNLSAFSPEQRLRLTTLSTDCETLAMRLNSAVKEGVAFGMPPGSLADYVARSHALAGVCETVRDCATGWLRNLRVDIATGALPIAAWVIQDQLALILWGIAGCLPSGIPTRLGEENVRPHENV